MTASSSRIAAAAVCIAVICGVAISWQVYMQKAIERKLTDTARTLRFRADQGDPKAEFDLCSVYHQGQGVPQDFAEAAHWCRKAADQGDAKAQFGLGLMYSNGQGVPQDYVEAARWYRKAADQGDAEAQYGLGFMYYQGKGVPHDYVEAARWYRKAAEQDNAEAQYGLGFMYLNGQGVPQDYVEATRWYRKAADQGDAEAQYGLGFMYYQGKGLPQDYNEANRWYRKAADQGNAMAQRALGVSQKGMNAGSKLRYLFLLLAFLGSLWLLIGPLFPGRSFRDRRQRAATLLGILGMSYVGVSLYGIAHHDMRHSICSSDVLYLAKGLLIGISIVIFVYLFRAEKRRKAAGGDTPPLGG